MVPCDTSAKNNNVAFCEVAPQACKYIVDISLFMVQKKKMQNKLLLVSQVSNVVQEPISQIKA